MAGMVMREIKVPSVNLEVKLSFKPVCYYKSLHCAIFYSLNYPHHLPQEDSRSSLWGSSPIESREECLHYSDKMFP